MERKLSDSKKLIEIPKVNLILTVEKLVGKEKLV